MKRLLFLTLSLFIYSNARAAALEVRDGNLTLQNGGVTIQAPFNPAAVAAVGCTFVQSTGNACVGSVCSSTFNATVTAGNMIVVGMVSTGENLTANQVTSKGGDVFSSTAASAGTSSETLIDYDLSVTGGSSYWVKLALSASALSLIAWEYSGCTALDTASARTIASASPATLAFTTTATGVIPGVLTYEGTTTTITPGVTYTGDFEQEDNSTYQAVNGEHKTSAAGSNTADWALGTSKTARVSAAAFK